MVACELANHDHQTQNTTTKGQDADPPARFASHHHKDSKAKSERGKSPTETTTEDFAEGTATFETYLGQRPGRRP